MIKVGDKVTWMHTTEHGDGGFTFSTRQGAVTALHPCCAEVKLRNGRPATIALERLRLASEKNHVTELFENLAEGAGQ